MEFSSDIEITKISGLVQELFEQVLYDEEPLFIGDEATIWDVSVSTPSELLRRCSDYYGVPVTLEDFKNPLWKLLPELSRRSSRGK
jgi:hypothetical protein